VGISIVAVVLTGVAGGALLRNVMSGDAVSWRQLSSSCSSVPVTTCLLDEAARVSNYIAATDAKVAAQAHLATVYARLGREDEARTLRELARDEYVALQAPSEPALLNLVEAHAAAGAADKIVPLVAAAPEPTIVAAAFVLAEEMSAGALRSLATLPALVGSTRSLVRTALAYAAAHAGDVEAARREAVDLPTDYRAQALVLSAAARVGAAPAETVVALVEEALTVHPSAAMSTVAPTADPWPRIVAAVAAAGDVRRALGYLELNPAGEPDALARAFVAAAADAVPFEALEDAVADTAEGRLRGYIERELAIAKIARLARAGEVGEAARLVKQQPTAQGLEPVVAVAMAERDDVELAQAFLEAQPDGGAQAREARLAIARALAQRGDVRQALAQIEAVPADAPERQAFADRLVVEVAEELARRGDGVEAARILLERAPSPYAASSELARMVEFAGTPSTAAGQLSADAGKAPPAQP
jgi:hypothetical protein